MKQIILLFGLLLAITATNGQSQFPGKHPELLLNKEVKIGQFTDQFNINYFYMDEKMLTNNPEIPAIEGKSFVVTHVTPYNNSLDDGRFKIKLENPQNGIVYYEYDPKYPQNYMLNAEGGLTFTDGLFCDEIDVKTDTYNGNITSNSPVLKPISFTKVERKGKTTLYISASVASKDMQLKKTGLTVFLSNGQKIEKPAAPVDVKVNDAYGYLYTAFETLTPKDIALLSENEITSVRLYIYDKVIYDGNIAKEYLKCITKK